MGELLLVRHGESEWNALHKLTGQADVALTELGKSQAREVARKLSTAKIDVVYTSTLQRAKQTFSEVRQVLRMSEAPVLENSAFDERDFGLLTGKSKDSVLRALGRDNYTAIIKGWNLAAPGGESLQNVYERVAVYYDNIVQKDLMNGKTVLVVSHHHTLRALIKHLEGISDDEISLLRLDNAGIVHYMISSAGEVVDKQLLI